MMSRLFQQRLFPRLKEIAAHFGTPFHLYDEQGIRKTCRLMKSYLNRVAFYRNFYAVKALPNPVIMKIVYNEGFGFDCSSMPELDLARMAGAGPSDIMFTSNNTSLEEYEHALAQGGCFLNLDDISFISKVPTMPKLICFRYNPGILAGGNEILGNPVEQKYGVPNDQIIDAYLQARDLGVRRFGLHTMICSNERDFWHIATTVQLVLSVAIKLHKQLGIQVEFVNIGGGFGIPYQPTDKTFDLPTFTAVVKEQFDRFEADHGWRPDLFTECGRYVTGPHGVLVTKVINRMLKYRQYVGVDSCMSALMRPAMYGAYHHIYVLDGEGRPEKIVDVVGSLCENNDKFAVDRILPETKEDDLLIIANTGAHGIAMGFNYNGRLRPQELLLQDDGSVELIRRAETTEDYFSTLDYEQNILRIS